MDVETAIRLIARFALAETRLTEQINSGSRRTKSAENEERVVAKMLLHALVPMATDADVVALIKRLNC